MKSFYFILTFFSHLFFSCSTLKQAADCKDRIPLKETNLADLNGKYNNAQRPNKDSIKTDLYSDIFDRGYTPKDSINYFQIKALDNNKLSVSYWDKNQIIKFKIFKGKINEDYFVFRRRFLVIPAIGVNLFRNRKFRIGLLPNGNIITDYNQVSLGSFYVILPFLEKKKYYGVEFERIN
jgi:hypothetical protein